MKPFTEYPEEFDTIRLQFVEEWEEGKAPSLRDYVRRYPQFTELLVEFVTEYVAHTIEMERTPMRTSLSDATERAYTRFYGEGGASPQTFPELIKSSNCTPRKLAEALNLPQWMVLQFQRGLLTDWPSKFEDRVSQSLKVPLPAVRAALAATAPSAAAPAHFRAEGEPEPSVLQVRSFREASRSTTVRWSDLRPRNAKSGSKENRPNMQRWYAIRRAAASVVADYERLSGTAAFTSSRGIHAVLADLADRCFELGVTPCPDLSPSITGQLDLDNGFITHRPKS